MPGPLSQLWSLGVYAVLVLLLAAAIMLISYLLGQRHRERTTDEPYESGVIPTGRADMRFDVKFYLVAVLFVIFDIEAAFVFAWAVALREAGWTGYLEMAFFISILLAGLFYLVRMGALDWGPSRKGRREGLLP